MKKAYLSILLLISLGMLVALQIGLKGERYATEGLEYYYRGDYARAIQSFKAADNAASGSVPGYFFWLGRLHIAAAVEAEDRAVGLRLDSAHHDLLGMPVREVLRVVLFGFLF